MNTVILLLVTLILQASCGLSQPSDDPCDIRPPVVDPCNDKKPRDLLFIVDASNSMDRKVFYSLMLDFTQSLYCAFHQSVPNRVGMILFGRNIDLVAPLDYYSTREWFDRVEKIRETQYLAPSEQACCTCCVRLHSFSPWPLLTQNRHHWLMLLSWRDRSSRRKETTMTGLHSPLLTQFPHPTTRTEVANRHGSI